MKHHIFVTICEAHYKQTTDYILTVVDGIFSKYR